MFHDVSSIYTFSTSHYFVPNHLRMIGLAINLKESTSRGIAAPNLISGSMNHYYSIGKMQFEVQNQILNLWFGPVSKPY